MRRSTVLAVFLAAGLGLVLFAGGGGGQHRSVTIAFDDGYASHPYAAQQLEARGWRGVFFIPAGVLNGTFEGVPTMTKAAVQGIAAAGHEVGGHTYMQTNLSTLNESQVRAALERNRAALGSMGIYPVSFAYPHGAGTEHSGIVGAYYTYGRTLRWGSNTVPPADPLHLKTITVTEENVDVLDDHLDRLEPGEWLIISLHHVDRTGAVDRPAIDVSDDTFQQVLDQVETSEVQVTTIRGAPWTD